MSAGYTNLRTVSYRDTIAELIARANQTHTRATGVQVFSPGDGMAYEDSEGFINPISPALFDDAKGQIAEASEALVAAEAELEAAQGRIDETTALLERLDEQAGLTAEEMKAVEDRLAQNEADLAAARDTLTKADADAAAAMSALRDQLQANEGAVSDLSETMQEVTAGVEKAQEVADSASVRLTEAEGSLATAREELGALTPRVGALTPRVGAVENAVTQANAAAGKAMQDAAAASSTASAAMEEYDELRVRLDAALAAKPGMIKDSGFTLDTAWAASRGAAIVVSSEARSATKVLSHPASPDDSFAYSTQDVHVEKGHVYRLTAYILVKDSLAGSANFLLGEGGTGVYWSRTSPIDLTSGGRVTGEWQPIQESWVAPDSRTVRFGFQVRGNTSPVLVDDFQVVDTTAEADLTLAVEDARKRAEEAARSAADAMKAAGQAQLSANGKTTITATTNPPSGVGLTAGDIHMMLSGAGSGATIQRQWRWNGSAWVENKVDGQFIANLDVGKLTGTFANISQHLQAGSISADKVLIGVGGNLAPDPRFQSPMAWGGSSFVQPNTAGRSAKGAFVIPSGTTTRGAYMSQMIPTPRSGRVWFSVWAKPDAESVASGLRIYARGYFQDGTWAFATPSSLSPSAPIPANTWVKIEGEVVLPEGAASLSIGLFAQPSYTGRVVFSDLHAQAYEDGALIVNGTITGNKVNAQSVAGAVGQFVKVQANNVEVTEALSARVVEALSTTSKRLVVTEDAILNRATVIQELVAPVVKATKVSTDQLIAGTASLDTATANKLFADIFAANKITAAQIVVGGLPSAALADGAVSAVKIADGAVTAGKVTATEELSAKILRATSAEVATQFVTDRLVIGTGDNAGVLEVLGKAITNDLNVRGTLRGRDAILDGTLDVAQLNVTDSMAAALVNAMSVNTRRLVVTEDAILNRATVVNGLVTNQLEALNVTAERFQGIEAQFSQLVAGDLTITGHFRSGGDGMPGVVIPKAYTTAHGMQQIGVWLTPTGNAPSLGSEWGMIAGMWLDEGVRTAGTNRTAPVLIRGQQGGGAAIYGDLHLRPNGQNPSYIRSNENVELQSKKNFLAKGEKSVWLLAEDGQMVFDQKGSGGMNFNALNGGITMGTFGHINNYATQDHNIRAGRDVWLKANSNIRLARINDSAYHQTWSGGNLNSLYIGSSSGIVYTGTSSERYKTDITELIPDESWLDRRVVTYRDKHGVKEVERLNQVMADDPDYQMTPEEYEIYTGSLNPTVGFIAEEAIGTGAESQVIYDSTGRVISYDYSRDGAYLAAFVKQHRGKIADLEARIAELESTLL